MIMIIVIVIIILAAYIIALNIPLRALWLRPRFLRVR